MFSCLNISVILSVCRIIKNYMTAINVIVICGQIARHYILKHI